MVPHNIFVQCPLLRKTHISGESAVRHPGSRCTGCSLLQHAVDLFERETFGFGNENVGVDEAEDAEGAPEEENFRSKVGLVAADEVGGDDGDNLVIDC